MPDPQCPESGIIGELKATVKALEKDNTWLRSELEKLRSAVILNVESRIYHDGVNAGKRSTDKQPFNNVYKILLFVGGGVVICIVAMLIYILAGAELFIGFIKAIVEAFK